MPLDRAVLNRHNHRTVRWDSVEEFYRRREELIDLERHNMREMWAGAYGGSVSTLRQRLNQEHSAQDQVERQMSRRDEEEAWRLLREYGRNDVQQTARIRQSPQQTALQQTVDLQKVVIEVLEAKVKELQNELKRLHYKKY